MGIIGLLESNEITPSIQRIRILDYLSKNDHHFTVDELYSKLKDDNPGLSKTTIYNTIEVFSAKGIVKKLSWKNKEALYDTNLEEHGHFICDNCKKVIDVSIDNIEYSSVEELQPSHVEIVLTGLCSKCK